jgi:hypothetical protein
MKLEKGKVYKCYHYDGSFQLFFSNEKDLYPYNDFSGAIYPISEFTKVEPYEPEAVDTLQEVVDWCRENEKEVLISKTKTIYIGDNWDNNEDCEQDNFENSVSSLLTHIRKEPKELTELKALAEKLGFELTKKD